MTGCRFRACERQSQREECERFDDRFELDDRFVDRLRGTLAPALRASESPIAIACFRLVTRLPERPLLNVPSLRSCIARSTFCWAFRPYFAIP
jgi:hypothetical protein